MKQMTRAEYARHARVNKATVTRWVQSGRIRLEPSGLLDPEAADRMRAATESPLPHHQARKAQIDAAKAEKSAAMASAAGGEYQGPTPAENAPHSATSPETGHRKPADVYMERKAEKIAIEIDRLAGALVERAEVDFILADLGNTLRGLLESLADRLAPSLAAHRGDVNAIHKALEDVAHDLLTEMSDNMRRKMDVVE